jgi:hypothetical protein
MVGQPQYGRPAGIGFFLSAEVWTVVSGLPSLWTFLVAALLLVRASRAADPVATLASS